MFPLSRALHAAALGFTLALGPMAPAVAAGLPPVPQPVASFNAALHVDVYGGGSRSLILIFALACGPWVWYGTVAAMPPRTTRTTSSRRFAMLDQPGAFYAALTRFLATR